MGERSSSRARVLFVDDEPAVLDGIRRGLSELAPDWEMSFVADAREAVKAAAKGSHDVVVTDFKMPGLNGIQMLTEMRKNGVDAEVIVLSGAGDLGMAAEAINDIGIFRYYAKPCPVQDLAGGIADAVRGRQAKSPGEHIIDLVPFAVIGLDAGKRVIFVNNNGARLLKTAGAFVIDASGVCRGATKEQTANFHQLVDNAAGRGVREYGVLMDAHGIRKYSILIERAAAKSGHESVVIFVSDIDGWKAPPVELLRQSFGLSNAEAKLAHHLASGMDIKEAATALGITLHTARTYLKGVFEKTNTNRQAELVRVLITTAPPSS